MIFERFDIKDADKVGVSLEKGMKSLDKGLKVYGRKLLLDIGEEIKNAIPIYAPEWSGFLKNKISVTRTADNSVKVVVEAPYSGFVEEGTVPHVVPASKQVWGFSGLTVGDWYEDKTGQNAPPFIPVTGRAQPFIDNSINYALVIIDHQINSEMGAVIENALRIA